jgi:hypothetical protein
MKRISRVGAPPAGTLPGLLLCLWVAVATAGTGVVVGRSVYLVENAGRVTAVNAETGQFFELETGAGEKIERRLGGEGVVVLVTNQRFAAIGTWPGGWASVRRRAGERVVRTEASTDTAIVVTSDRTLSFSGRSGIWSGAGR